MANETPLQAMKRLHGSKDKLVDSLAAACRQDDEDLSETKERLKAVSNKKLLRIAEVEKAVSEGYGGVDKLVDSLAAALGRSKDTDYVNKLRTLSHGRLLDMVRAAEKRARRASAA